MRLYNLVQIDEVDVASGFNLIYSLQCSQLKRYSIEKRLN